MEINTLAPNTSTGSFPGSSANNVVRNLLSDIQTKGTESAPRGLKVRELNLQTLEIDPFYPLMDFEARPFGFKYFMGEMAWYLTRDTNIEFISKFSSFWNNIADSGGNVNSNYGKILYGNQLQWALDSLKKDPNTRQAIAFVNQPKYQYEGNKDFVCTMYLNFWIRDNKLNMKVQMRSNDIFYGLSYDAPFFAFIQQSMWHWLRDTYPALEIGTYYHCADNIHYYERHFETAQAILDEGPKTPLRFYSHKPLFALTRGIMVPTTTGHAFMEDVVNLLNSGEKITQESSKEIISKYFYIQ